MKNKDLEVFQANSFIESRQSYTLQEKRLLSTIISFVKPTDTNFITYDFSIKEWADLTGKTKENFYQIADDVTDGLMGKIIKIDKIGKDGKKAFKKFHVMSTANYEDGVLKLEISKDMNDIFLQLQSKKNYTHYELIEFVTLTSTHAQRIYELIKQYQHSKNRKRTIGLFDLKTMLGIEDKYKEFKEFRRKVLNVALKQIEEHTTLRYKWQGVKRGRKIHSIEFYEIHIAGKENPTELQEKAFIENYIGQEIYNEEISSYFTISEIKKEEENYIITDKETKISYRYKSLEKLQESIAKAIMNKI